MKEPEPVPVEQVVEPVDAAPVEVKAAPVEVSDQVLVPQVAYSYLPYATNYPYYSAVQAPQQVTYAVQAPQQLAYAVQAPQYVDAPQVVEIPQATIPIEPAKAVEAPIQIAPPTYTIQTVAAPVESVQPAVPVVYSVQTSPALAAVEPEPQAIVSVPILTQYHSQDELGQYNVRIKYFFRGKRDFNPPDSIILSFRILYHLNEVIHPVFISLFECLSPFIFNRSSYYFFSLDILTKALPEMKSRQLMVLFPVLTTTLTPKEDYRFEIRNKIWDSKQAGRLSNYFC